MQRLTIWVPLLVTMMASAAVGQPSVFYPAQGQSPEKQSQDFAACWSWATQQTGSTPFLAGPHPPGRLHRGGIQ